MKRGSSYFDQSGPKCQADARLFRLWAGYPIPVLLIVFAEDGTNAYWHDIRRDLRQDTTKLENGPFTVHIPPTPTQVFDEDALRGTIRTLASAIDFGELIAQLSSEDAERREAAIRALFPFRFERRTLLCLSAALRSEPDPDLMATMCDFYSRYFAHPEASFGAPTRISSYAATLMSDASRAEVVRVLGAFCDEEYGDWSGASEIFGMHPDEIWVRHDVIQRGTVQQGIAEVVGAMTSDHQLLSVAGDPTLAPNVRKTALGLFGYLGHSCTLDELEHVAEDDMADMALKALVESLRFWIVSEESAE